MSPNDSWEVQRQSRPANDMTSPPRGAPGCSVLHIASLHQTSHDVKLSVMCSMPKHSTPRAMLGVSRKASRSYEGNPGLRLVTGSPIRPSRHVGTMSKRVSQPFVITGEYGEVFISRLGALSTNSIPLA